MLQQPGADESYRISSRDTAVLARQYMAALSAHDACFVDAYQLDPSGLPDLPLAQIAPVDNNSGDYQSFLAANEASFGASLA